MEQLKGLQKSLYIWTDSAELDKRVEALKSATGGEVAVENVHRLSFCKCFNLGVSQHVCYQYFNALRAF